MLHFNRDRRLTASDVLDPFIVPENPQRLGDRLVDARGADLDRVFNSSEIEAGNPARLQGHTRDLSYSRFLRQAATTPVSSSFFWAFSNRIKYIFGFELSPEFGTPKRMTYDGTLAAVSIRPSPNLWVLEIQVKHPSKLFGGFFEDLLLMDNDQS
jgi:hypothetical protein